MKHYDKEIIYIIIAVEDKGGGDEQQVLSIPQLPARGYQPWQQVEAQQRQGQKSKYENIG